MTAYITISNNQYTCKGILNGNDYEVTSHSLPSVKNDFLQIANKQGYWLQDITFIIKK